MNKFEKTYHGKAIQDNGTTMSKDGKGFVTAFKNMLKRTLEPKGINVLSLKAGHYYCFGFLERDGRYIYICYSIPRYGKAINFRCGGIAGVLYRRCKHEKDFTGGANHFCAIHDLPTAIVALFEKPSRECWSL